MRELVRIDLPLPLAGPAGRVRPSKGVVRTKSGNVVATPTPSTQPPSVSSTTADGESERAFSPQFSSHSSADTVLMASSCESATNEQPVQVPSALQVDIPIKEVPDMEEPAGYESDDSLKDLNWLGGLNPSKICQSKAAPAKTTKQIQSPRRPPQPTQPQLRAPSPRNRQVTQGSTVAPYMKRVNQTARAALSPIRQSSPVQANESNHPTTAALMSSSVPVSQLISQPPWVTQQREARRLNRLKRPPFSYVALCCMALASSETLTLPLTQIYKWIEDAFPYYAKPECYQDWRSSIRHTLSLYSFFQSVPVVIGRKTIPTWRLDITESERIELGKLVNEYSGHQNSQFISEWTSRLVYAEQRSHRRGAYDRQASKFKAFSALRSRSSSTDTLTSTHSTSTSATGGYQSYTPDSGMSTASGPTPITISEADISLLSGALTSITAATVASVGATPPVFQSQRHVSPAPVVYCSSTASGTSSSPAMTSSASIPTTAYETGPGITIIRIPPNAPKFGLLVLGPSPAQTQLLSQQQQQSSMPATPMSVVSDQSNSSVPLFDLTNNQTSGTLPVQFQSGQLLQQQNGNSLSILATDRASVTLPHSPSSDVNFNQYHQQPQMLTNVVDAGDPMQQSGYWKEDQQFPLAVFSNQLGAQPTSFLSAEGSPFVETPQMSLDSYDTSTNVVDNSANPQSNNTADMMDDFGASMDLEFSLNDFVASAEADELFADGSNIDFATMFDGALDTPRSVLLPSDGSVL